MDISPCASGCQSLSRAERVLCPHLLPVLHIYINFVMKHQLSRGNRNHSCLDARAKEVLSVFVLTAHDSNGVCHHFMD